MNKKISNNVLNVLALLRLRGIGKAWIIKNYSDNLSEKDIVVKVNEFKKGNKISEEDFILYKDQIQQELENISDSVDGFVAFGDKNFPIIKKNNTSLFENDNVFISGNRNLSDEGANYPVFLAYKGDLDLLDKKHMNIAVIGLTTPNDSIKTIERKIVKEFVNNGAVIVSGLAIGCDTIAHKEALNNDGVTIAILPSTIKNIYPKENLELAENIVLNGGLLISEYYSEIQTSNHFKEQISRLVERDRLQALFSDMVILTASYSQEDTQKNKKYDSGSRHAMENAKKYSIKRAVIYDENISKSAEFNLNNEMIKEYGSDIDLINKTNRDFKVITKNNLKNIISSFKNYKYRQLN
ncbi:TPA: DNA-processing protein DprA [Campylobacter coli]|nr:DNA-processing protein DprA [Campylobacter coli]HEB9347115.1 DNA-processing protein DprA [Campylobacter coli]HEB9356217.1 DNA-processing protein DprA [Campylobacter coli]